MATLFDEVKEKLELFPSFRERSLRGIFLAKLALRKTGLEDKHERHEFLSHEDLVEFAITFDSYRHAWGDVTRECENLRGTDYAEGEILAQEKILEFGYEPGHNAIIKKLKLSTEEIDESE
jgi:hypothetical protein